MTNSTEATERRYGVKDLDDLRRAIEHKWLFGTYLSHSDRMTSRAYGEVEKVKAVEELVRTHMLAGHTAEDLYASERKDALK